MSAIFDALNANFAESKECRDACRKMYEGIDPERKKTLPHVIANVRRRTPRDSFTSDIEEVDFDLVLRSKAFSTDGIDAMVKAIRRQFDDCYIETADLCINGMLGGEVAGPIENDAVYEATITYKAYAAYNRLLPTSRGG